MWTALALLLAIIGKSGQFPLHTWLPDAMAGPTPVSALIHAATMVVAGVYLGARLYPVFWHGLSIGTPGHGGLNAMAVIGGITVLIGAALAFVQDDIKKVLAYSTISQLGYMVMALGVGAWTAAVFHLFTHAFFKADLFLGAGSVSHSGSHHSFDMKKDMGGLKKYMPQTFWTFIIGSLALAGIFPLAGFWSKDEILVNAGHNGYQAFVVVGAIGAFMTAAYMTRCVYLTFFGEYRGRSRTRSTEAHEARVHAEGDELVEHHLAEEQDDYIPGFGAHATDDASTRTARTRATASSRCRSGSSRSSRCSPASLNFRSATSRSSRTGSSRASPSSRWTPAKFNVRPGRRLRRDRARSGSASRTSTTGAARARSGSRSATRWRARASTSS